MNTEKTWEAFEARWDTLTVEGISHAQDIMDHVTSIPVEFNLQQLNQAGNFFGLAFAELRKCIEYEKVNLTAEIGPKPEPEIVDEPVTEEPLTVPLAEDAKEASPSPVAVPPLFKVPE